MLAPLAQAKASAEQEQSPTNVNLAQTANSITLPLVPNGLSARRPRSARWSTVPEMAARPVIAHLHQLVKTKTDVSNHMFLSLVGTDLLAAKIKLLVVLTHNAEQLLSATRRVRLAPALLVQALKDALKNALISPAKTIALAAKTAQAVIRLLCQDAQRPTPVTRMVKPALDLVAQVPRDVLKIVSTFHAKMEAVAAKTALLVMRLNTQDVSTP